MNCAIIAREVASVADPFREGERVVLFDSPSQYALVGTLGENRSVYLAIDDRTVTVTGEDITGEKDAEQRLLSTVDQVICVSPPLAETLRARVPERADLRIDVVTNGYDNHLFTPDVFPPEPAQLADIPRPRVLVAGHVSDRIDWDGIAAFATTRPDVAWVFLGPADPGIAAHVARLAMESGAVMRVLPPVAHAEVPAYVAHSDVCAAPYRLNTFTRASSPLKVIEYLGAGAPVVSTRVDALQQLGDAVYWLDEGNEGSYRTAIEAALSQGRASEAQAYRTQAVEQHSWHQKAAEIFDIVSAQNL